MRDSKNRLVRPEFKPEIPEQLLHQCSPADRWMYENLSMTKQQNEWLITQALDTDVRQGALERKMALLVSVKWSTLSTTLLFVIVPAALVGLGAWLTHWFDKKP